MYNLMVQNPQENFLRNYESLKYILKRVTLFGKLLLFHQSVNLLQSKKYLNNSTD